MKRSIDKRKLVLTSAILIALSLTVGYIFLFIPNVEFLTAAIFISGYRMGPYYGTLIGMLTEWIFSSINPMGAPSPPLLLAQIASMAFAGWSGGLAGKMNWLDLPGKKRMVIFAAAGFLLTLFFDLLTTLSFALFMYGTNMSKIIASFAFGALFYGIHIVGNTMIFALIVPFILQRLVTVLKWDS